MRVTVGIWSSSVINQQLVERWTVRISPLSSESGPLGFGAEQKLFLSLWDAWKREAATVQSCQEDIFTRKYYEYF